ncbi:Peptidyl-prolyl cis-trans isomerase FKBP19, chloroplastic [Linum grandiflorum]
MAMASISSALFSWSSSSAKTWRSRPISSHQSLHQSPDSTKPTVGKTTQITEGVLGRRQASLLSLGLLLPQFNRDGVATASQFADMPALRGKDYGKSKMKYPDYTETSSGLQYKDLRQGTGATPNVGETVVVDWDGYTIGYYGRIFEARNKTKGGSFEVLSSFWHLVLKSGFQVIPAFEEAVSGMALGGIRRIVVPPELGYPDNDYNKSAPRPTTFSGQRALDFVLRNQGLIDKTLLFDIELIKIVRPSS